MKKTKMSFKKKKSTKEIVILAVIILLLLGMPLLLVLSKNSKSKIDNAIGASLPSFTPVGMRPLTDPVFGVTVDDVANVSNIVNSSRNLSHMPTTRIVFDEGVSASYYVNPVNQIQPVSYIMGELLDSEGLANSSLQQYHDRAASYLATLGDKVDIWEIGNEVNGNWTGPYADVSAKLYDAHKQVKAAGKRSALTLWYNDRCGNGPSELDPIAFSQQYIPADMRNSLDYVFVSYYETQCNNIRPSAATLTTFFSNLHELYPNARLGFGEIGFPNKVGTNTDAAISMINYYYGLNIPVPGYVGGYFWWYYYEDMLPYTTKPLWQTLTNAFNLEAAALSGSAPEATPTTVAGTSIPTPTNSYIVTSTPVPTTIPATPTPIAPGTSSLLLFGDGLGSGWQNWSWDASVNLSVAAPVYSGTRALSFSVTKPYGAFSLGHSKINVNGYKYLHFAAQATTVGQKYTVSLQTGNGKQIKQVNLSNYGGDPTVGAWKVYTIPLSVLNPNGVLIKTVDIEDAAGKKQPLLYVDDVKFVN